MAKPSDHERSATFRQFGLLWKGWSSLLPQVLGVYVILVPSLSLIPSVGPYNEKRVLQIGFLIAAVGVLIASSTLRRQWLSTFLRLPDSARWLLSVVLVGGIFSAALAPSPFYAFLEVGHFILLFVAAGVVASVVRQAPKQTERVLLWTVVVSTLLYAVYFAVRYGGSLVFPGLEVGRETITGFANTRFFNQYQTWTLPLLGGATLAFPKRWRVGRCAVFFLTAIWWTLVLASNVRGTVIAMGVASIGVWLLFRERARHWLLIQAAAVLAGSVLYFFAFYLVGDAAPQFAARMQHVDGESWRIQRWLSTLELTALHPWLGIGPMHFAWPPFHFEPGAHPHNAVLQWMVEWGIPSTVLMTGMSVWGGWRWIQQEKEEAKAADARSNAVRVALVASILAGAAHAMVSGLLVMPVSQMLLVLVGGWAWGRFQHRTSTFNISASIRAQAVLCVLLVGSIGIVGSSLKDLATIEDRRSTFLEAVDRNRLAPRYWTQGYIGVLDSTVIERARYDR